MQVLPHTVPHQLFSSSAVINPLVTGMLGLNGNSADGTLTIAPHLPQGWTVHFDHYRVGKSLVSGTLSRTRGEAHIALEISGARLEITFSPAFARGAKLQNADLNGAAVSPEIESNSADTHLRIHSGATSHIDAAFRVEEPAEPAPVLVNPSPGDPARR